ncbi:MAG: tyrosine-protein phosphatase [Leifsonia sp.]
MVANAPLPIPGTYNFRDVGGYPARDGVVRRGVLFRSDGLSRLDDAGRDALRSLAVHTIIDLRDEYETTAMPDAVDGLGVDTVRLPVFEGSGASQGGGTISLEALYARIVTQHSGVVIEALRTIAGHRDGAVLVHCTAGKDRTGVIVALALLAVGVDRALVVEDYAATESNLAGEWLEGMIAMVGEYGVPDSPELRVLMGGSPSHAIAAAIDLIERDHGSIRQYLLDSGLTIAELSALEDVLVDR